MLKGIKCEAAKCAMERRPFPPGHRGRTRKLSEYGIRLREKQKLRFFYGISEKQMRINFQKASRQIGVTGYNMLTFLERRMDNIVYRVKLARSRKEARQLVKHGHFMLNGKRVDIPSILLCAGDIISVCEGKKKYFEPRFVELKAKGAPAWVVFEDEKRELRIERLPKREEIDTPVREQLIVEFYSR
jgi:small subunit ribosomal protein S4